VSDDEEVAVLVLVEIRRERVEVGARFAADDVGIEIEEKPRGERDLNALAHALHGGSWNVLLQFVGLLVHLIADDRAGGAAHDRADDGATCRVSGRVTDDGARSRASDGPDGGSLARPRGATCPRDHKQNGGGEAQQA